MAQIIKIKKFEQIVSTARDLFMFHGIRRITVEEICAKSGVSKMTFYKHFNNKVELAKHILNRIIAEAEEKYHGIMNQNISY